MSDLIRCSSCEGWGITSYEKDGSPNACERCQGSGQVQKPPAPVYPLYGRYEKLCREAEAGLGCNVANPFRPKRCGEEGKTGWYCDQCKTIRALTNAIATLENEE